MSLATAYRLPYRIWSHEGPLFDGSDVEVYLRPQGEAEAAAAAYGAILTAFEHLAWTGALSGDRLAPSLSGIGVVERQRSGPDRLVWRLAECRFDERAAVILAQMFLLCSDVAPLAEMAFVRPGLAALPAFVIAEDPAAVDPYPGAYRLAEGLPAIDDSASDDVTLIATFDRALDQAAAEEIDTALTTWAAVAAMGAYGDAPTPPAECGLQPPDRAEVFGNEVEFSIRRLRAHRGALDGLANAMMAFHERVGRLVALSIA